MIDRIIESCAKHKFLVFLFIAVGVLLGWRSLKDQRLAARPKARPVLGDSAFHQALRSRRNRIGLQHRSKATT